MYCSDFDRVAFLKNLKSNGMPKAFQVFGMKSKWVTIYSRFIASPAFETWFRDKQNLTRLQITQSIKKIRMEMRAKDLVKNLAPTLYDMVRANNGGKKSVPKREIDSLVSTLRIIKKGIENELDENLVRKMWEHYLAVSALLPERFAPVECIEFAKQNSGILKQLSPKREPKNKPATAVPRRRLDMI